MIQLKNLSKTFKSDSSELIVLKDINLEIKKGEIFGIIGLSGAGKSTLIRCINFLETPTSGEVIFDNKVLNFLSSKELNKARQDMGMIFQNFNLLSQRTALKNICFPLEIAGVPKDTAKKRAKELLELVGLSDKAKAYPSQLSGGQQQRVAIARALATNPKVLLCDEATSALDPNTTRSILELLQDINKKLGVTVVIVTHEMSVIEQVCNRVAVIHKGNIQEIGEVKEIFIRPKSKIAKQLILPKETTELTTPGKSCLRIIFDGNSAYEPIIAQMAIECGAIVNILYANTRNIKGKAVGEMVLQLPEDEILNARIRAFLDDKGIAHKEENYESFTGND